MNLTLADIKWAASECERQRSGEKSVYWLCSALDWLRESRDCYNIFITKLEIKKLGIIVEPSQNFHGFRTLPITIKGQVNQPCDFERVLEMLCDSYEETQMTPDEFYYNFQTIHPFNDGNGRVGSLIWNLLRGDIPKGLGQSLKVPPKYSTLRDRYSVNPM